MNRPLLPAAALLLLAAIGAALWYWPQSPGQRQDRFERRFGKLIYETKSAYSHIRLRQRAGVRSLMFVEDDGTEHRQSAVDLAAPDVLQLRYTRALFASSLLFGYPQVRVLIVGLGGGGMVRFLNHHLPETQVEVVEIDPEVVQVAADYFEVRQGPRTLIRTQDAYNYLRNKHGPFDAVYMDAFLKPPADARLEHVTERLKTVAFLRGLHKQLKPGGLVAFNLVENASTKGHLEAIRSAFPNTYVFGVPGSRNLAVIGSLRKQPLTREDMASRARTLEDTLEIGLSFRDLLGALRE